MTWFYKEGGQEFGPVGKEQLQQLIKAKKISGKTLIRSAPTDPWRPLAEVAKPKKTGIGSANAGATAPPPAPPTGPSGTQESGQVASASMPKQATAVCSQCGRSFPNDQVVKFDDKIICAACKPIFVQRMKEGVSDMGAYKYAGFWIRAGAKIIDLILLSISQFIIMVPIRFLLPGFSSSPPSNPEEIFTSGWLVIVGIQQLISIAIPAVYNTFFIGRFGATLGKMACRIKVVTPEDQKVSYARALGRNFAEWLSGPFTLGVGYIMAAFDSEKRALHDRICSTRVVHR